ncbi:MAG: hypothetical protein M3Z46_07690 [Actinomycetota bacterium]|nr:hypothetical protein [Actinomycetota bacterium]
MAAHAESPNDSTASKKQADKSTGEVLRELWDLVKDYGKQETIDPLKSLGRFVGFGAPGSVLLALGVLLLSLGALRGLQIRTGPIGRHLTGSLNWVPYAVTLVVAVLLILAAVKAIGRTAKGKDKDAKERA